MLLSREGQLYRWLSCHSCHHQMFRKILLRFLIYLLWYRSYAGIHLNRSGGIYPLIEFLLLIGILLLIIQSLVKWQNHRHQRHKHRRTYHRHQSLRGWGCGDCRKFLFLFF